MTQSIHPTASFVPATTATSSLYRRGATGIATLALYLSACRDGLAASRRYDSLRARGVPHAVAIVEALEVAERG